MEVKVTKEFFLNLYPCEASSNIQAYLFREKEQTMYILFRSAWFVYVYHGVTPAMYEAFLKAESKGKWVSQNLVKKPEIKFEKLKCYRTVTHPEDK